MDKDQREYARLSAWHRHFCIWPRRVGDRTAWLQWVERRLGTFDQRTGRFTWQFRVIVQ
jgi:hypothetical protein